MPPGFVNSSWNALPDTPNDPGLNSDWLRHRPPRRPGPARGAERAVLWLLLVLSLAAHLWGLYSPGSALSGLEVFGFPGADKLVHFTLFAAPVYLLGRLSGRIWGWAFLFAALAGISELIQWRFIPNRDGDLRDAVADLLGVAFAVLLLLARPGVRAP